MALTNANYRESTANQSWYNSTFRSTYDLELMPQTWGEVLDRYDVGLGLTNFLNLAGRTMGVRNKTITIHEKGAPTRPVTVTIGTAAAPISAAAVTPSADDDSDDFVREGFEILIPASYTNKEFDVPMRLYYNSAWYVECMDATAAITTALSEVYVAVGASAFGYGSAGADPMSTGTYSRTTGERIMKDAVGIEGGVLFNEEWQEFKAKHGGRGVWTRSIGEMDFRLDDQIDSFLLTGIANSNTTHVTQASIDGSTKAIPSTDGLIQVMIDLAQEMTWDATGWDADKFRAVKVLLENVGVVNKAVDFFVGSDLNASIELQMIDFLKTNAGGTKYWNELGKVGFMVNSVKLNGVDFNIAELGGLSNPNKYGLASYNFKKMGFMFTQGEYAARLEDNGQEQNLRLPHLTLGYPLGNGENRQRIFTVEPGVNGIAGLPNIAVNSYDGIKMHTLAHVIPIWNHMYKTIKVTYDDSVDAGS